MTSEGAKIPPELIEETKKFARTQLHPGDAHGWPHVERVLRNARRLHLSEGGNWDLIVLTVLLHDVGRREELESIMQNRSELRKSEIEHHAVISARKAREFLAKNSIPEEIITQVESGILTHSFSAGGRPETIEAKIVSDADKLDALGAIGIYRTIAFQVEAGTGLTGVIRHFHEKLLKLGKDLFTSTAKELAKKRTEYMQGWLSHLEEETGEK